MAIISDGTTMADAGAFSVALGSMIHIKTLTASSSANLSFVHGTDGVVLDNTYPIYKFVFINCHPATNNADVLFQASTDGGSSYGITTTSTYHEARHAENDGTTFLGYNTGFDLAQSTDYIHISGSISNEDDSTLSGELTIYSPSNTTFVKHYISRVNKIFDLSGSMETSDAYVSGYFNNTSAINAFDFKMDTGNMDSGKIKLYGIKDS